MSLPLAAVAGPVSLAPALPDSLPLLQVVPLIAPLLPFAALALVASLTFRWTGSTATTTWTTVAAAAVAVFGGIVAILVVWPTGG